MAEAITEMIIPGTYIEVRAEGLIGVSGIATGNVGVVGTASKGPIDEVQVLSSFSEARDIFGDYDSWVDGKSDELTLVRALQQVFDNGGSTIYAVRCADNTAAAASRTLLDSNGAVVTLTGKTNGSWAHDVTVKVNNASENAFVEENKQIVTAGPTTQPLHKDIADSARNTIKVTKTATGQTFRYSLKTSGQATAGKSVLVNPATGVITFHADDVPAVGDTINASYEVNKSSCRDVVIKYKNLKEVYTVADAKDLKRDINNSSRLVNATIASGAETELPDVMPVALPLTGGANGEAIKDYKTSLATLDNEPVNIVVLAGLSLKDAGAVLLAHLETTENNGKDRIGVVGADADDVATVAANADTISDDRLILVAPGIKTQDLASGAQVSLPAAYAAAAVAGLIASLAVQVSPTNKALKVSGLSYYYNDGELKKLLTNRVMAIERKAGFRIVKGITTDNAAFRQVSVRRIVDYAKAGTRMGSNPYIGRLNNARVRGALKATLNGFLSDMVLNEALTEFTLDVTATREQEIAGVALVTMFLKPTFSIDYIKVIMNLS
ncbi:MAG: phage tail sheath subtilisin-like domain-containing protein [Acidobacteriota bacterium]